MGIFWAEDRWMKKRGAKMFFCHDEYDKLKELVIVRSSIEISDTCFGGSKTHKWHGELGHQTSSLSYVRKYAVSHLVAPILL